MPTSRRRRQSPRAPRRLPGSSTARRRSTAPRSADALVQRLFDRGESPTDLVRRGTPIAILFEARFDQRRQWRREVVAEGAEVDGLRFEDFRQRLDHRRAGKRGPASQHLVKRRRRKRTHPIGRRRFSPEPARGSCSAGVPRTIPSRVPPIVTVGRRWSDVRALRSGSLDLRQSEVEHFHDAIGRDLDVGRLQVAMDDAPFVGRGEHLRDLPRDGQRVRTEMGPRAMRLASVSPSTSSRTSARIPSASSRP